MPNANLSIQQRDLARWDREHYWHAFTQMAEYEPFIVEQAEGIWLETVDGKRFIDGVSSMWCNVHGHRHPKIDKAIQDQLGRVSHVTSLGMSNPTSIRLARKLSESAPAGLDRVFFSSDGASAVEVALKQVFQYWRQKESPEPKRDLFIALGNSYHGDTIGSVSVGGVSRFHAMFEPLLFEVAHGPCPEMYRTPDLASDSELTDYYLARYRELLERFSDRVAAVILEPLVQGAAGVVMHPPGFLAGMRQLCDEFGTLMIADEIAVGMGRTGTLWACEQENVIPDFLCTGKGLSGGYLPVAATLTSKKVWDAFLGEYAESKSFFHGHTFGGNPLGCAAALATLEVIEEEGTLERVGAMSTELERVLEPLKSNAHVGDVRSRGLIAGIELVQNKSTRQGYSWADRKGYQVCDRALEHGVWLRPIGNVIVVMPPLCAELEHLEAIANSIQYGLEVL